MTPAARLTLRLGDRAETARRADASHVRIAGEYARWLVATVRLQVEGAEGWPGVGGAAGDNRAPT
jgi:hypothetical protein